MRFSSLPFILLAITLTSAAPINKAELQSTRTGADTRSLVAGNPDPEPYDPQKIREHIKNIINDVHPKRDLGSRGIPISHNAAMNFQRYSHTSYKPSNKLWKRDPKKNLVHWSVTLDGIVPSSLFQFDDLTDGPENADREEKSSHHKVNYRRAYD